MRRPRLIIDDAIPYLRGRLEEAFECEYMPGRNIGREDVRGADGLLVRTRTRCDARLLEGSGVSFVATGTIGLDHFDTGWLTSSGIDWQNAPGCNAPAVAQYVWSVLLRLGFHLPPTAGAAERELRPMTLGVVGKGHVGSIVVEWGRMLGAEVLVCDPPRREAGERDEDYLSLEELSERCDALTFHTPLTDCGRHATRHLCDASILRRLHPGVILINAARGGVVDEAALREAAGDLSLRVAIDTWEGEPRISAATMAMTDIATPHIAGYSRQGKERATMAILTGLERHFGVTLPKEGLAGPYKSPTALTPLPILESFDPMPLDAMLRAESEDFETLRDSYIFRDEPKYRTL